MRADVRDEDAVTKLFNETAKEFANRNGGCTRIYKLGARRRSDAAELAIVEFVKADDPGCKKQNREKSGKARKSSKSAAPAAEAAPVPAPAPAADEARS